MTDFLPLNMVVSLSWGMVVSMVLLASTMIQSSSVVSSWSLQVVLVSDGREVTGLGFFCLPLNTWLLVWSTEGETGVLISPVRVLAVLETLVVLGMFDLLIAVVVLLVAALSMVRPVLPVEDI